MKETRYYLINPAKLNSIAEVSPTTWTNKRFIAEAERQGLVCTQAAFETAFNEEELSCFNLFLRIITVDK